MKLNLVLPFFVLIFMSSNSFAVVQFTTDATSISSLKKEKKSVTYSKRAMSKKTIWNIVWGGLAFSFVVLSRVFSGESFTGLGLAAIMLLVVFLVRKGKKNKEKANYDIDIADSASTKRSLKNFKIGTLFLSLGGLTAILGILTTEGLTTILPLFLAIGLGSVGFVFSLISFIQAIIAYKRQEPLKKKSLISIILFSVIFLLPLATLLALGIKGLI